MPVEAIVRPRKKKELNKDMSETCAKLHHCPDRPLCMCSLCSSRAVSRKGSYSEEHKGWTLCISGFEWPWSSCQLHYSPSAPSPRILEWWPPTLIQQVVGDRMKKRS